MSVIDQPKRSESVRQCDVVVQIGQTPAQALATVEPDAKLLHDAAAKGAVWIKPRKPNGQMGKLVRLRELHSQVLDGSELFANLNGAVLAESVTAPTLIDAHPNYSFWFKPRGVLSQGSKWGDHTAMPYLVAEASDRTAHLVHRLDRDACGLMVVAHTRPAVRELTALFATRNVIKRYDIIVSGSWAAETPYDCKEPLDEKPSRTCIENAVVAATMNRSHLSIRLYTGRKHQIRRHLALQGFAVVGDTRYGDKASKEPLALMSTELEFTCPFSQKRVHCKVPKTLRELL